MSTVDRLRGWVCCALVGLPNAAFAEPLTYRFQAESSFLYVRLRPAPTLLSGLSHKHIVRAPTFEGAVVYDRDDPGACRIQLWFSVASLVVDAPADRKRVGLEGDLSPSDREDIRENMLAEDQLHARENPSVRFVSTGCKKLGSGQVRVDGGLTIRGRTVPVSVPLLVVFAENLFHAEGELTLDHAAFGFEPYSAALGALKNHAELRFGIEITGAHE